MMKQLYITFVRPLLDYGDLIWFPTNITNIREVETIQRRATKMIAEIRNKSYLERINDLGLSTLYFRRSRMDLIQVYKILNNKCRLNVDKFFITRNKSNTITLIQSNSKYHKKFSFRVVKPWNSFCKNIELGKTIDNFKSILDKSKFSEKRYNDPFLANWTLEFV